MLFCLIIVFEIIILSMCHEKPNFRLPTEVVPVSYVLHMHPDLHTEMFTGDVSISIDVLDDREFIAINSKNLSISSARLLMVDTKNRNNVITGNVILKRIFAIQNFDIVIIETQNILLKGSYELRFKFSGALSKKKRGFFITSYTDTETGNVRKIAATRFEPTYARRAFPCFDEPSFKTDFKISIVHPTNDAFHAFSNMPIERSERSIPMPGLTTVYFQMTPRISTYLVGFSIIDLVNRTALIAKRWETSMIVPINAWSILQKAICADLVLHMTYRAMDLYMLLFKINYPLSKIDLIAIPGLSLDPIDSWGLVTFDEASMLYYSRSNSIKELKLATNHIVYGIVQMWFGSLVTISRWNDFWLIKSFATYMQAYTTNWVFPEWKEIDHFHLEIKYKSMTTDSLVSAQPISRSINSPLDIYKIVQSVPKDKGASIILMLHHIMGERHFFQGVSNFLRTYSYENVVAGDFFDSLQKNYMGGENLTRFVDTWIGQSGYPLLNVERVHDIYYVNQTRFLCNNVTTYDPSESSYLYKWDLPIFYTTNLSNETKRIFLPYDRKRVLLLVNEAIVWVKFNTNSIGYYSVNYDKRSWKTFVDVMRTRPYEFRILDRVDILNDAFVNADAGRIPYHMPMDMLEGLKTEKHFTMWTFAFEKFSKIQGMLTDTEIIGKFEAYVISLMIPIYNRIGWATHPRHTFARRRFQMAILKAACALRMEHCIQEVTERFRYWISNPNVRPHPDIKELIYYYGMLNEGNEDDWNVVYNLLIVEPDVQERRRLMICLTAIQNTSILINYFEIAKDPSVINEEEYLEIIGAAALNPISSSVLWNFYTSNWDFFTSRYDLADYDFARLIIPITSNFRKTKILHEITKFFEDNEYGDMNHEARTKALEIVQSNIVWMVVNYAQLKNWLNDLNG